MSVGNKAESSVQRVLTGDHGTEIKINLNNVEQERIFDIEWVRAYDSSEPNPSGFIDIPDFRVYAGVLYIKLPSIPAGQYNLEIKDDVGRFYPAKEPLKLTVIKSTVGEQQDVFVSYKGQIIREIPSIVQDYVDSNKEMLRGPRGHQGDSFTFDDFTQSQLDELKAHIDDSAFDGMTVHGHDGRELIVNGIMRGSQIANIQQFNDENFVYYNGQEMELTIDDYHKVYKLWDQYKGRYLDLSGHSWLSEDSAHGWRWVEVRIVEIGTNTIIALFRIESHKISDEPETGWNFRIDLQEHYGFVPNYSRLQFYIETKLMNSYNQNLAHFQLNGGEFNG